MMQYVQDYDEMFPVPSWNGSNSNYGYAVGWPAWPIWIYPYVKSAGVFECPDDKYQYSVSQLPTAFPYNVTYNYNLALCGGSWWMYWPPSTLATLQCPTQVVLFEDQDVGEWAPTNPYFNNFLGGIHTGGDNISFTDGHVKWYRTTGFPTYPSGCWGFDEPSPFNISVQPNYNNNDPNGDTQGC
jgi:prepilin-type processing-associated H-X9-DG protein